MIVGQFNYWRQDLMEQEKLFKCIKCCVAFLFFYFSYDLLAWQAWSMLLCLDFTAFAIRHLQTTLLVRGCDSKGLQTYLGYSNLGHSVGPDPIIQNELLSLGMKIFLMRSACGLRKWSYSKWAVETHYGSVNIRYNDPFLVLTV